MSYLDLDKLTPEDLIMNYVVECRGVGHFVPYQDHQVIDEWLRAARDADTLLLVLSEVLPAFYEGARSGGSARPRSLAGVRKLVLKRLQTQAMREAGGRDGR